MQFAVPQFTDVEDKLIGPLTLKQFLMLLATGGVVLMFWSIFKISFFFFVFAVPVSLVGLAFAFGKLNGRPLYLYLGSLISFFSRPQVRIFRREEPTVIIKFDRRKPVALPRNKSLDEPAESRLKKLAYLLDQKTAEEKELITRT